MASNISSASSLAVASFLRDRPGSPCMPTPISISSSVSVKIGVTFSRRCAACESHSHRPGERIYSLTELDKLLESRSRFGGCSNRFDHKKVSGYAPTPNRIGTVLHGDIVIDKNRLDRDPLCFEHFAGHLEGHSIAAVVIDDVQNALGEARSFVAPTT